MTDLEDRLRASLQHAAAATLVPPPPALARAEPRRRHTTWRTSVGLVLALVPVTGALAAAGYLPGSLLESFSFPDDEGAGPSTLQLLGAVPGPDGQRLELWSRPGEAGRTCFLSVLVPDDEPADLPTKQVTESSGSCDDGGASRSFGEQGGGGGMTFTYDAGTAVRAEVQITDGTRLPAVVADGHVAGWVPSERRSDALLVGYDTAGQVLGRIDITPWDPPPGVPTG